MSDWDNADEVTVPYQFEVPVELHGQVMDKVKLHGVKLAPYMRMAFEQFNERDVVDSMKLLQAHNDRKNKRRK